MKEKNLNTGRSNNKKQQMLGKLACCIAPPLIINFNIVNYTNKFSSICIVCTCTIHVNFCTKEQIFKENYSSQSPNLVPTSACFGLYQEEVTSGCWVLVKPKQKRVLEVQQVNHNGPVTMTL